MVKTFNTRAHTANEVEILQTSIYIYTCGINIFYYWISFIDNKAGTLGLSGWLQFLDEATGFGK
jgi:hypothetical protein